MEARSGRIRKTEVWNATNAGKKKERNVAFVHDMKLWV